MSKNRRQRRAALHAGPPAPPANYPVLTPGPPGGHLSIARPQGPVRTQAPKSFRWDGVEEEAMLLSGLRSDNLFDGLVGGNCNGFSGGGWTNNVTGTGNFYRDKVLQASFQEAYRIDDPQLSALFNGNDIAQRIIMAKPKEMFRRGWVLSFPGTGPAQAGGK